MLNWSVIEHESKFKTVQEYDHVRELAKCGIDYLLLTFDPFLPYILSQSLRVRHQQKQRHDILLPKLDDYDEYICGAACK
ncbi:hypothetical protein ACET3Z_022618 [Daucus carota]